MEGRHVGLDFYDLLIEEVMHRREKAARWNSAFGRKACRASDLRLIRATAIADKQRRATQNQSFAFSAFAPAVDIFVCPA